MYGCINLFNVLNAHFLALFELSYVSSTMSGVFWSYDDSIATIFSDVWGICMFVSLNGRF